MRNTRLAVLTALLSTLWVTSAVAHKASDAYLQLNGGGQATSLRIDVALRDLNVALDLDTNGDGALTWGENKDGLAFDRILCAGPGRLERLPTHAAKSRPGEEDRRRLCGPVADQHLHTRGATADPLRLDGGGWIRPTAALSRSIGRIGDSTLRVLVPQLFKAG